MPKTRTEYDSLGPMTVPAAALYGAQTARALEIFPVSGLTFPRPFLRALAQIKEHRITSYNVCYTKLLRKVVVLRSPLNLHSISIAQEFCARTVRKNTSRNVRRNHISSINRSALPGVTTSHHWHSIVNSKRILFTTSTPRQIATTWDRSRKIV